MPAPTSTGPEEREFVVDSEASNGHDEHKRVELRRDGHTVNRFRTPTLLLTAGSFHDLNQLVAVKLREEMPGSLSLGKF